MDTSIYTTICTCLYIYTHTYIYVCVCISYIHTHTHTHTYSHTHTHTHTHTRRHTHTHTLTHTHVRVSVCVCVFDGRHAALQCCRAWRAGLLRRHPYLLGSPRHSSSPSPGRPPSDPQRDWMGSPRARLRRAVSAATGNAQITATPQRSAVGRR